MFGVKHSSAVAASLTLALCVWIAGLGQGLTHQKSSHHADARTHIASSDGSPDLLFGQAAPAQAKDCCNEPHTCEQCACHFLFLVQAEQTTTLNGPGSLLPSGPIHDYEEFILGPPSPPPPSLS